MSSMNTQARPWEQAGHVSSRNLLVQINLVVCTLSYWTIIVAPTFLFKIYYIATAIAIFITSLLLLTGALRTDKLLKSASPLFVYFFYLFLTSLWALYPSTALKTALIDLIFIFVFGLFFIIGLNNKFNQIANIFILAAFPAVLDAYFFYQVYLDKYQRVGYGSIYYILPYALPFCIWKIKETKGRRGVISFLLIMAIILICKSRTPILIAGITIPLTIFSLGERFRASLVFLSKLALVLIICLAALLSFERSRSFMLESLGRFAGQHYEVLGENLPEDYLRTVHYKEGLRIVRDAQPFGIGYNNFVDIMEERTGITMPMHCTPFAWVLEGGIPLLILGCYLIYRFYAVLLALIRQSENQQVRDFCKILMISMLGVILHGLTHHAHRNPAFFILMGLAFAMPYRRDEVPVTRYDIADSSK